MNARRDSYELHLPYLRVANVYANELRLDDVATIGVMDSEIDRSLLVPGDLLVVEGNGSIDQIGRVAEWRGEIKPCVHQNHLIKVRFLSAEQRRLALLWLLSPGGRSAIQNVASSTSGLHTLSISKVAALPMPLCPTKEMRRVTSKVEEHSSCLEQVIRTCEKDLVVCSRLRQSILKWAFEGRLVDQNPTDEPASVLLDRVRLICHDARMDMKKGVRRLKRSGEA